MGFHDREYSVYVVLGDPKVSPPWMQATWAGIAKALDPLVRGARDRTAVRSAQMRPGPGSPNQRGISFGRIGWNEAGASKWTHRDDGRLASSDPAEFLTCEVWAPSWTVCQREVRAPEVYFGMRNESSLGVGANGGAMIRFSSCCLLAVARDMVDAMNDQAVRSAQSIALDLNAVLRARTVRPWGYATGLGSGYSNAINDLTTVGLFKVGLRDQVPATLSMLDGTWEAF